MMKHPFWFGLAWYASGLVTGFMLGAIYVSMLMVQAAKQIPYHQGTLMF